MADLNPVAMPNPTLQASPFQIVPYTAQYAEPWDTLVAAAPMATFMHTQRFISYHGNRFQDCSVLIEDSKGKLLGVFPAAVNPQNSKQVVSHPGLSFGGILHANTFQGESMVQVLEQLTHYYRDLGFTSLRYKAVPRMYHQTPAADDLYALFRLNAQRYRCDLASTMDVKHRPPKDQKRRWELKQASKNGIIVAEGPQYSEPLWEILEENLSRKHQAKPVHSLAEIQLLHSRFPENIHFVVGLHQQKVLAGLVLFTHPQVVHAQYMASSSEGYEGFALHPVIEHCIEKTLALQARYFDFGISNEEEGRVLNQGLHRFKSKFGASGEVHEFFELQL